MRLVCCCLMLGTLTFGAAAPSPAAATPPATDCSASELHQFDFWLGQWEVTAKGELAGHNRIEWNPTLCTLQEQWTGAKGLQGSSVNVYDRQAKLWRQFWVDAQGTVLQLHGGIIAGGAMQLQGRNGNLLDRITWTPASDGSVRQLWEQSNDDGAHWQVIFDGLYQRQP